MASHQEQEEEEKATLLDTHEAGSSSGAVILQHTHQGSMEMDAEWEMWICLEASEEYDQYVQEGHEWAEAEREYEDQMWYMQASAVVEDITTGRLLPIIDKAE